MRLALLEYELNLALGGVSSGGGGGGGRGRFKILFLDTY